MAWIIVRYAEIGTKGKNRGQFEEQLKKNIATHLQPCGSLKVSLYRGRLLVSMEGSLEQAIEILKRIPGIANFSPGFPTPLSLEGIVAQSQQLLSRYFEARPAVAPVNFRVTTQRSNKRFALTSTDVNQELGAVLLQKFPQLKVDLFHPQIEIGVEIWAHQGLVYLERYPGIGGLPVDPRQKVISLMSGGIDSPVASWMMMRRGCRVIFLNFHSFPFIGEQSKEKVLDLVKALAATQPKTRVYIAPFAEVQKAIRDSCPESLRTILYRRVMNLVANEIAAQEGALALITGDSLSQVASQTLDNLVCTTVNSALPILRPLIGMGKNDIIEMAQRIGTYTLSIQDVPDCCTLFQPHNPATRGRVADLLTAEANLDLAALVNQVVQNCERYDYSCTEAHPA